MNKGKNGFINILFDNYHHQTIAAHKKKMQDRSIKELSSFIQENVFLHRSKMKNTRVFRVSDQKQGMEIQKQIKKMFVDGSHLTQLIPRRQLVTQNYQRNVEKDRMYSPQIKNRRQRYEDSSSINHDNQSLCESKEAKLKIEEQKNEQKDMNPEEGQFQTVQIIKKQKEVKDDFISLDCSTNSSSNKGFRRAGVTSVRYRRIPNNERKSYNYSRQSYEVQQQNRRKAALSLKKQLVKYYSNHFGNPQNISSKAYIVLEHFKQVKKQNLSKNIQVALNSKINLQIASLTKIMTCILTIELCQKYNIDIFSHKITIDFFQTKVQGTSADLIPGQIFTVQQLLYGLMLPSGNDASIALSVFCGQLIQNSKKQYRKSIQIQNEPRSKKNYYKNFILQMNKKDQYQI